MNLDLDELKIPPDMMAFLKNVTSNVNQNSSPGNVGVGANQGVLTPIEGNYNIPIILPSGDNLCVGGYSSEQTNEYYFFIWNGNGDHTIWVINGDTMVITKVFQDKLIDGNNYLPMSLDPAQFFCEGRVVLQLYNFVDPINGLETNYKFLIFTNNNENQFFIEVNAAIATSSYSTSFFTSSLANYNTLELFLLTPPTPLKTIGLNTPVAYTPVAADANLQNMIIRNGWQFRIKFVDIFGRETEHGIISATYISATGGACFQATNGMPRCLNLNFDAGNPLVAQIYVEYRQWVGDDRAGALSTGWNTYDVFNKYNTAAVEWYSQSANPLFTTSGSGITYNAGTNVITYTFCADKAKIPIDPNETSRTQPLTPRISNNIFAISQKIGLANNVRGFENIPQAEIDKVVFSAKLPTPGNCQPAPTRTIIIYAQIYSPYNNQPQIIRKSDNKAVFGGSDASDGGTFQGCSGSAGAQTSSLRLGQIFGDQDHPGFIGYLAGTNFKCISEQGDFNPADGSFVFQGLGVSDAAGVIGLAFANQPVQRFVFTDVPAGVYIFRIASHRATINDDDYQKTSTYVAGIVDIVSMTTGGASLFNAVCGNPLKEISVDCSAHDVIYNTLTDPLAVIFDLANNAGIPSVGSGALDGYLYEEPGGTPVEMNPIKLGGAATWPSGVPSSDGFGSFFTDHNGFYFCASQDTPFVEIWSDFCDGSGLQRRLIIQNGNHSIRHGDGSNSPDGHCWGDNGNWRNQVYLANNSGYYYGTNPNPYPDGARRRINQTIEICATTTPLAGIPIVMTKGAFGITDPNGFLQLIAHNRYSYSTLASPYNFGSLVPDYSGSPNNIDYLLFAQKEACNWNACGNCNTWTPDVQVNYLSCSAAPSGCTVTTASVGSSSISAGGSGYSVGDLFQTSGALPNATGVVTSVNSSGAVTGYRLNTFGNGYTVSTYITTNISGTGTGFLLNVLSLQYPLRTLCLSTIFLNPQGINLEGVQSGGRYYCGFVLHDAMGRHTTPQVRQGNFAYITIPNINDVGYQQFLLSQIKVVIDPSFVVDPKFTRMTFVVSANALFTDYISLPADWVQPVDNTGQTNLVNPTALRIYYGSLLEYNKQNNFSTNTQWQFITNSSNGSPVDGDMVQFIMNGTGEWLPSVITAPITYDRSGLFFTIEYLPALAGLTNNCLFRIIRPNPNTSGLDIPLYETGLSIPIVGGVPTVLSATLPYADSYMLGRAMPVPRLKGQPNSISPTVFPATPQLIQYTSTNQNSGLDTSGYSTNNINNSNGVVIFDTIDDTTSYPFFFESPSPADTWGSHLASRGRVFAVDPYAGQYRNGTEIAISDPLLSRINGLSYFESQNIQIFDRQLWGDITCVLVETSEMLVICNSDHFGIRFNSTQLRADEYGNVSAQNPFGIFTAPERKSGENFGCVPLNINTIRKYLGYIYWLDAKGRLIKSNMSESVDVSKEDLTSGIIGGYSGYLQQRISRVNQLNGSLSGFIIWHGGIDPKTHEYVLTAWYRQVPAFDSLYLNDDPYFSLNDYAQTVSFDLETGILKNTPSFTPEYYGMIPGFQTSKNFISFKKGQPWFHHIGVYTAPPAYANFYGTQCKCVIQPVVNLSAETVKRFLWMEIYTKYNVPNGPGLLPSALFYIPTINTDKGQLSELLIQQWDIRDNFQCAAFLCDQSGPSDPNLIPQTTTHRILDGNPLQGRWLSPVVTTNPAWLGTYFELSAFITYVNGIKKSGDT